MFCTTPVPHRTEGGWASPSSQGKCSVGFSGGSQWGLMSTHEYSWVFMGSQWVLMGSHGFSVGTQTVYFGVLCGFSDRHPPSDIVPRGRKHLGPPVVVFVVRVWLGCGTTLTAIVWCRCGCIYTTPAPHTHQKATIPSPHPHHTCVAHVWRQCGGQKSIGYVVVHAMCACHTLQLGVQTDSAPCHNRHVSVVCAVILKAVRYKAESRSVGKKQDGKTNIRSSGPMVQRGRHTAGFAVSLRVRIPFSSHSTFLVESLCLLPYVPY